MKARLGRLHLSPGRLSLPGSNGGMWRQLRACVGLALALSVVTLGLVLSLGGPGDIVAEAGPPSGGPLTDNGASTRQDNAGFHVVNVGGIGDTAVSGQASEHASGPTFYLTATRQAGPCALCTTSAPSYDPDMGFFNLTFSSPATQEGFTFCRYPCMNDTHDIAPIAGTYSFLYIWLDRDKGCGDFQMSGTFGGVTNTNIFPLNIPCTGGLPGSTMLPTFSVGPGSFFPSPFVPTDPTQTLFVDASGNVSIAAQNQTATWMQGQYSSESNFILGSNPAPVFIGPGGTSSFPFSVAPVFPQSLQGVGMAAASQPRITATMVFSFGPTARISQTLILARPDSVYLPLAERGLDTGW
ncbi:MAG: hypothetical protein Q7R39_01715 [Dehalococcoidia bacterium]|nr:hypothetical protein [Dehalococcoidia bacterium]